MSSHLQKATPCSAGILCMAALSVSSTLSCSGGTVSFLRASVAETSLPSASRQRETQRNPRASDWGGRTGGSAEALGYQMSSHSTRSSARRTAKQARNRGTCRPSSDHLRKLRRR